MGTLQKEVQRAWFIDPQERMIQFAEVTGFQELPARFTEPAFDILWKYWLDNCANGPTEEDKRAYKEAHDKIAASRSNGSVSSYDMQCAGFVPYDGRRMVPKEVVAATFKKLIDAEPPC